MSIISQALDNSLIPHIASSINSADMWNRLNDQYERTGRATSMYLRKKLFTARLREGENLSTHLNQISELVQQLEGIKKPVTEEDVITIIINSLPPSFENLSTNLEGIEDLTLRGLKSRLLQEEVKRAESSPEESQALNSDGRPPRNGKKWCTHCRKPGHTIDNCFRKNQKENNNNKRYNSRNGNRNARNGRDNQRGANNAHAFMISLHSTSIDTWYVDSGASRHMCCRKEWFTELTESNPVDIYFGDDSSVQAAGTGTVTLTMRLPGKKSIQATLHDVLYVPSFKKNLLASGFATRHGVETTQTGDMLYLRDQRSKKLLGVADYFNGLYTLRCNPIRKKESLLSSTTAPLSTWHQRLGHVGNEKLIQMTQGLRQGEVTELPFCEGCALGKQSRAPIHRDKPTFRAEGLLDFVSSDVMGPVSPSLNGATSASTFTDNHSRRTVAAFMKKKSETLEKYQQFEAEATNAVGRHIKILRSDQGGEYTSKAFSKHCGSKGTIHQFTAPYTPEQNSISERRGRTLMEMARCMLKQAKLPDSFWAEAFATANYINNRTPMRILGGKTPEEVWTGQPSSIEAVRTFGCRAYALIQKHRPKLNSKATPCMYIGPANDGYAHKLYNPKTKKVFISRNVLFDESILGLPEITDPVTIDPAGFILPPIGPPTRRHVIPAPLPPIPPPRMPIPVDEGTGLEDTIRIEQSSDSESEGEEREKEREHVPELDELGNLDDSIDFEPEIDPQIVPSGPIIDDIAEPSSASGYPNETVDSIRRSTRAPRPNPAFNIAEYDLKGNKYSQLLSAVASEPLTVTQAVKSVDADQWIDAMQVEYDALIKNKTWDLVPLPPGRKSISTKWLFKIKQRADGSIDRHKARFVVRGYSQVEGIDYDETFAPVGRFGSLRVLLAIAVQEELEIHMMDVDAAFLNGIINEDIYITQPEGFINSKHPDHVCKLKKSLYGLKQAPRVWNSTLDNHLKRNGFNKINSDPCIYVRFDQRGRCIIFIYVDDLLIICALPLLKEIKSMFTNRFNMKDLGEATTILNMAITRDRQAGTLRLAQPGYIHDMLTFFSMNNCRTTATPLETSISLPKLTATPADAMRLPYRQAVGKLTYAATATRPDIAFATGFISRHMSAYSTEHWAAVKRILRYLNGCENFGLLFRKSEGGLNLQGYADADWGGDKEDRKSTTGYIFLLCNAPVTWASKKQSTIAVSSTEAEYLAASQATKEALWLRKLLSECGFPQTNPTVIFEDNQGCIALSENPVHHPRTKHFDIQHHFVREKVQSKEIVLKYCPTNKMLADFLTKSLSKDKFCSNRLAAGIISTDPSDF